MSPIFRRLRRYLLVGLIVIAPVGLTVYVLVWLFQRLDSILGAPLREVIGFHVPGLGFVLLTVTLLLVGWLVHLAVGRQLLHWWNQALVRFPLTGRIYNALSQIVQSLVGGDRRMFQRAVIVPYLTEGLWAIGFVTNEDPELLSTVAGEPCITVFLPTPPNPATGFLLVVPKHRVRDLPISIEEAVKLVISLGAVSPAGAAAPAGRQGLDLDSLLRGDRA
ncbi:MAG TPA: DUF502 domain-containing protein [Gemmatimonadales bacterium]|nr:DUF502 domain-containing protein [Gemmatimonadales bacterium]